MEKAANDYLQSVDHTKRIVVRSMGKHSVTFRLHLCTYTRHCLDFWAALFKEHIDAGRGLLRAIDNALTAGLQLDEIQEYTPLQSDKQEIKKILACPDADGRAEGLNGWVQPKGASTVYRFR